MSLRSVPRPLVASASRVPWGKLVCLAFLGSVLGCGGGSLHPVEGNVSVDGSPLAKGTVTLWPEGAATQGEPPGGDVQNGKFKVYTKGQAGAPEGKYKVTVSANEEVDSTKPFKTKSAIPGNYRERSKTPLTLTVGPSQSTGNVELAVKTK